MTIRDFMNYLIYVEHAAENLQFYLWFKDYEKRFQAASTRATALAPEWTRAMDEDAVAKIRKEHAEKMQRESQAARIFKGTDFEKRGHELAPLEISNPFTTPPQTPNSKSEEDSMYAVSNTFASTIASSYQSYASDAFRAAGARQPCKSDYPRM